MRNGFFRRGMLGALAGAIGAAFGRQQSLPVAPSQENPLSNRQGGGHRGSKPHSDSTQRIRALKRWLKKRRRNSRRGVYTTRGPQL